MKFVWEETTFCWIPTEVWPSQTLSFLKPGSGLYLIQKLEWIMVDYRGTAYWYFKNFLTPYCWEKWNNQLSRIVISHFQLVRAVMAE